MVYPLSDTNTFNEKNPKFEKKSDDSKGVPGIPTHFSRTLAQTKNNPLFKDLIPNSKYSKYIKNGNNYKS